MPDYPTLDGLGAVIIAIATPGGAVYPIRDATGAVISFMAIPPETVYPVRDGNGAVILAGPGGIAGLPAPTITGLLLSGLNIGIARIWSTISYEAVVTGDPDGAARRWLLDGSPMQGAEGATLFIDPSFNGSGVSVQLDAVNATDTATLISGPAVVAYPAPQALGAFPALSGAVGDLVDITLAGYFYDGNPNSNTNASLTYTATGLPAGLFISGGRLIGVYSAPVTAQPFTISATNSGGVATVSATSTITGGAFLYNYDFNIEGAVPAEFTKSNTNLRLTVDAADAAVGTYGSVGALRVEGFALPGGVAAAGNSNVQRDYDVSAAPDGTVYQVTVCGTVVRNSAISVTGNIRLRWVNAAGTVVLTEHTHSITTPTAGEKTICDGVYTMTKPAGLLAVKLRVQLDVTNWTATSRAEIKKLRLDGGPAVIPVVTSAILSGDGKIGSVHTAEVTTEPAGASVALAWYRSGVLIAGATSTTYTPVVGDDVSSLTFTATPTGGSGVSSNGVDITRQPPVASGVSLTPSEGVPGATLTYSVGSATNGATATFQLFRGEIVVASGSTSGTFVATDAGAYRLVVVWQNSGGQAVVTQTSTIAAPAVGQPVVLFSDAFATAAKIAEFTNPSAWTHNAALTNGADLVPGAIQFGTALPLATSEQQAISKPFTAGRLLEAYVLAAASSGTTLRITTRFKDAGGAPLWSQAITAAATGATIMPPAAPPGTTTVEMIFELRGAAGNLDGVRKMTVHKLKLVDITDSGPTPVYNNAQPQHNSPHAYANEQTVGIDFAVAFTGAVTHYVYSGPEPHTWVGSVLYITPTVEISPTVARYVTAFNAALESNAQCLLRLRVYPTPTALILSDTAAPILDAIEVNRPMRPIHPQSAVTGGKEPFTYAVTNKPSWVIAEDHGGLYFGVAPATAQALVNMVIRVTDARGAFVDVTYPIQVVATRSRAPYATLTPTLDLEAATVGQRAAGRVFQLQAGNYAMGNWYNKYQGDPNNPMIIRGVGLATIMHGGLHAPLCEGIIFENMAMRFAAQPLEDDQSAVLSATGKYNRYYDLDCEGWTRTIPDTTGFIRPDELYVHAGVVKVTGTGTVLDNVHLRKLQSGFGCEGRSVGIYRSTLRLIRDDMNNASRIKGLVLFRVNGYSFDGNHTAGEHRDFFQAMNNNTPGTHEVSLYECFYSGGQIVLPGIANEGVQGCFLKGADGYWPGGSNVNEGYTYARANTNFRVRGCTFFAGSNYGMYFGGHIGCKVDKSVAVGHPEQGSGNRAVMQNAGDSDVLTTGTIYESNGGDGYAYAPTVVRARNLANMANTVRISGSAGAVDPATIFPNWATTGLTYEDPREAVANGQPASAARFWINPASAWAVANPEVAPAYLRTGA